MRIALLLALVMCSVPSHADEPNEHVVYSGRWGFADVSSPWCAWQGSSFAVALSGTGIKATIESDQEDFLRVIVDGDHVGSSKIQLESGRHEYLLASELDLAWHTIEVVKETYIGPGRLSLHELDVIEGEIVPLNVPEPKLRIQFYGDSNLAGHSLEHERNQGDAAYTGCHFTFAGITSRMLGAEYQNISVGGATILGRQNSVLEFFDKMDFYQDEPKWPFERFPVDICVVNIGANNVNRNTKEEIKRDYQTLLQSLREAHPESHIVVMNGYGWDRNETANYTQEVIDQFADDNVSRVVFPWLFNEWHGCEYDHAGMARVLAEHLATIHEEWVPVRPMDVMDGFGRDGDVANGSFEFAAPFGGYGWRYFQDGAIRIHAPEESPAGEWYLQIPEHSQVHQPNPAEASARYTFRLKLRSPDSGEASIRIEFRDQQYRNEIEGATEEFIVNPGVNWQEYSVRVDSPDRTGDESRDVWQIIVRIVSGEGTIECDDVRLSVAKEE